MWHKYQNRKRESERKTRKKDVVEEDVKEEGHRNVGITASAAVVVTQNSKLTLNI